MTDDRIAKLSQRFKTHAVGRRGSGARSRERNSFYFDRELVARLDQTYRQLNHELYPSSLSKSAFLEVLIEYGLDHLGELRSRLDAVQEGPAPADIT